MTTAIVAATATLVGPTPPSASASGPGEMFITRAELMSKPTSGAGWTLLKSKADLASYGTVDLGDQDSLTQSHVLAGALVYARTGNTTYRDKVIAAVRRTCGTEADGPDHLLGLARTLYGYVVAADLVQMPLSTTCTNGQTWRAFLQQVRTKAIPGHPRWQTLEFTSANTSNNWGAYALSSHLAVSYALGDTAAIQRDINIFKRFLGDATSPAAPFVPSANYSYNGNGATWDMTRVLQRGINPYSANDPRQGALIEDVLRLSSGGNDSVACCTVRTAAITYQEETLDGMLSTAQLLRANGIDLRNFENQAMRRAFHFFISHGGPGPYSLSRYIPYAINYLYGTNYPTRTEDRPYRHMGYGSWLFTTAGSVGSSLFLFDHRSGRYGVRTMSNWSFELRNEGTWSSALDIVVVGDFDRDGVSDDYFVLDRQTGNWGTQTLVNFVPQYRTRGTWATVIDQVVVGDFDSDGYLNDLFVWDTDTGKWNLQSMSGFRPTFRRSGAYQSGNNAFVVGDWDGDGRLDDALIWSTVSGYWVVHSFAAFQGTYRSRGRWSGFERAYAGDWDRDRARDDLLLWDDQTGKVAEMSFAAFKPTYRGSSPFSSTLDIAAAADLDRDGYWNELFVFDRDAAQWQVHRWAGFTPTMARAGTFPVSYDIGLG